MPGTVYAGPEAVVAVRVVRVLAAMEFALLLT
jgi:hypothetical protein